MHIGKIHDNPKSYNCDTCEKKFTDKSEFNKHNSEHKHHPDLTAARELVVQQLNVITVKMTPLVTAA